MRKNLKKFLQLIVYASVIYFIVKKLNGNVEEVLQFDFVRPQFLLYSILVYSLHTLWNAVVWHKLMAQSGEKLPLLGQMDVYIRSYLLRYIPGNIVGILARGYFNKPHGVKMIKSLWGWFFENIVYLVLGGVIGSYVIFALDIDPIYSTIAISSVILFAILGIFKLEWLEYLFERFIVPKLPKDERGNGNVLNMGVRARVILTLNYLVSWLIACLSFVLLVYSAVDITALDFLLLSAIYAAAWSIGYASFITPSGSGVREAVMIQLLSQFHGLDATIAVVIALTARVLFILGELLSVAVFYLVVLYNKRINKNFSLIPNEK
jgi:hypothetical protein